MSQKVEFEMTDSIIDGDTKFTVLGFCRARYPDGKESIVLVIQIVHINLWGNEEIEYEVLDVKTTHMAHSLRPDIFVFGYNKSWYEHFTHQQVDILDAETCSVLCDWCDEQFPSEMSKTDPQAL